MAYKLKYLCIHCTATPVTMKVTVDRIKGWHMNPKPRGRGWSRLGYSDLIALNGSLINMTDYDQDGEVQNSEMTWGVRGINKNTRHVVYVGGVDRYMTAKDTRTEAQLSSLETYVRFTILRHPNIKICGHNQFAAKACPSFDVPKWLRSIGIKEKNIYDG